MIIRKSNPTLTLLWGVLGYAPQKTGDTTRIWNSQQTEEKIFSFSFAGLSVKGSRKTWGGGGEFPGGKLRFGVLQGGDPPAAAAREKHFTPARDNVRPGERTREQLSVILSAERFSDSNRSSPYAFPFQSLLRETVERSLPRECQSRPIAGVKDREFSANVRGIAH